MILEMGQVRSDLSEHLKSLRESRGLSQKELGKISGVSWRSIQNAEQGKSDLGAESLAALAETFSISVDELLKLKTKQKNELLIAIFKEAPDLNYPALDMVLKLVRRQAAHKDGMTSEFMSQVKKEKG